MPSSPIRKVEYESFDQPVSRPLPRVANDNDRVTARPQNTKLRAVANDNDEDVEVVRPRDAAIRAAANDSAQIRRVQTKTASPSPYPTVDQEFSASYATNGIQPFTNNLVDYKNNTVQSGQAAATPTRQIVTERASASEKQAAMRNTVVEKHLVSKDNFKKLTHAHNMNDAASALLPGQVGSYVTAAEEAAELVPLTWGIWLTFQVPMALVSLVTFSIAILWGETEKMIRASSVGEFIWSLGEGVIKVVNGVLDTFLGLDLSVYHPTNTFLVCSAITMFIAWTQFLIAGITYAYSGIPCLNGKGSTLKYTTLILGLVCGALPVLNFIPFASFWVIVVAANPTDDD